MGEPTIEQHRAFLRDDLRMQIDFRATDQSRRVPPPPVQKPAEEGTERVGLPSPEESARAGAIGLTDAIRNRRSRRRFVEAPLSLPELSYLLWATQGIRKAAGPGHAYRTVPSAGCRHAFESYIAALRVEGLEVGLYRYLPDEHELLLLARDEALPGRMAEAALGQGFAGRAAATFVWTAIPYRMEWRYGLAAHRVILMDAGHVCQNLYLACEAIGAGTCAIGAYDQRRLDALLGVDGEEEFAVYMAPVGKV